MKRGLLMPSSIVSYAHSDRDIHETVDKIQDVLIIYKKALDVGIEKYLVGESVKPVYRKFN
jgi:glutamate-1-semialdehyde 2,1-aminomutase